MQTISGQPSFWGLGAQAKSFEYAITQNHDIHYKALRNHQMFFASCSNKTFLATLIDASESRERRFEEILKDNIEFYADFDSKPRHAKTIPEFIKKFETEFFESQVLMDFALQ